MPSQLQPPAAQPDLSPYRRGNTGIDYVHRFDSGRPGPDLLVNALTHGNEICGMVAVKHVLDEGIRPRVGTLTLSFANVAAYEAFDPERPFDNRQLVHNLNRIWTDGLLDGSERSPELDRARELRPVVAAAQHILDIHSTSQDVAPFWVYPPSDGNTRVASAIGQPDIHLVMPTSGGFQGAGVLHYGAPRAPGGGGTGVVVECGQHFDPRSAQVAIDVTLDFLAHFGQIDRPAGLSTRPQRHFVLLQTHMVKTAGFRFTRPLVGFETFDAGDLIAEDGDEEIRSPCNGCTVFMPTRQPIVGREAVYLTRPA